MGNIKITKGVRRGEFLKKVGVYSRYLNQFLGDGDVPRILETIKELERIRRRAEREKLQ